MSKQINVDVAIIGAGTAGLYALREVRRAKKSFVLIDSGPLGTTCARVGCMPSKVALHMAESWHGQKDFTRFGISGAEHLQLDSSKLGPSCAVSVIIFLDVRQRVLSELLVSNCLWVVHVSLHQPC